MEAKLQTEKDTNNGVSRLKSVRRSLFPFLQLKDNAFKSCTFCDEYRKYGFNKHLDKLCNWCTDEKYQNIKVNIGMYIRFNVRSFYGRNVVKFNYFLLGLAVGTWLTAGIMAIYFA